MRCFSTVALVAVLTACGSQAAAPKPVAAPAQTPVHPATVAPAPKPSAPATTPAPATTKPVVNGASSSGPATTAPPASGDGDLAQAQAEVEALRQRGEFTKARTRAEQAAAACSGDATAKRHWEALAEDCRRLARDAASLEEPMARLTGNAGEVYAARQALRDGGEAAGILLTRAIAEADAVTATQAASLLLLSDRLAAFPALVARYQRDGAGDPRLGPALLDSIRYLARKVEPARLALLTDAVRADTTFAQRGLAGVLLDLGDDAAIDAKTGAGTAARLIAYVKSAADAKDSAVQTWAYTYAERAQLGLPGLTATYWTNTTMEGAPAKVQVETRIEVGDRAFTALGETQDNISARWTADLIIPTAGEWTFFTTSDDGSRLSLDGQVVVDNWGDHGMTEVSAARTLTAGPHALVIEFYQGGGGSGIVVHLAGPGVEKSVLDGRFTRTRPVPTAP